MTIEVPLSKPITTHRGEINSIKLNEPTAKSFIRHGEPFTLHIEGEKYRVEWHNAAIAKFICDMAGINEIEVEQLSSTDFIKVRGKVQDMVWGLVGGENPTK